MGCRGQENLVPGTLRLPLCPVPASMILFSISCAKKPLQRSDEPPLVKQKASRTLAKAGSSSKVQGHVWPATGSRKGSRDAKSHPGPGGAVCSPCFSLTVNWRQKPTGPRPPFCPPNPRSLPQLALAVGPQLLQHLVRDMTPRASPVLEDKDDDSAHSPDSRGRHASVDAVLHTQNPRQRGVSLR